MSSKVVFMLLVFGLISLTHETIAQKESKYFEKGVESFNAGKYKEALDFFEKTQAIDPDYEDLKYKAEIATLLSGKGDDKSLNDFLAMEATSGSLDDHYFYYLGKIYIRRYQISKAIDAFEKFHERIAFSGDNDESTDLIAHSTLLKSFFENPGNYEIHQLESPINTAAAELSPSYFQADDELLFASDRDGNGEQPFSIYFAKSGPNGWEGLKKVDNLGNFSRSNANIEVVNEDGRLFLFREEKGGDLFYSQSNGNNWVLPVEFDARVSNNHLASHFFINEHEDRIIFASDENETGLDIYESFRDASNDKWSRPRPFHSAINSVADEDSPYMTPDESRIYFSSNRKEGIGGMDIYYSEYDPASFSWSEPVNLGWPINSPNDEIHYKLNPEQTSGYFSSNRLHSKGDYDIYFFWNIEKVKVEGRIFDNHISGPITNAEIRFHPSQYLDEYFSSTVDTRGHYQTSIISNEIFDVEIIQNGQIIHKEKFEIHDAAGQTTTHIKDFSVK